MIMVLKVFSEVSKGLFPGTHTQSCSCMACDNMHAGEGLTLPGSDKVLFYAPVGCDIICWRLNNVFHRDTHDTGGVVVLCCVIQRHCSGCSVGRACEGTIRTSTLNGIKARCPGVREQVGTIPAELSATCCSRRRRWPGPEREGISTSTCRGLTQCHLRTRHDVVGPPVVHPVSTMMVKYPNVSTVGGSA